MRKNMNTHINGTNIILVPYQEKHVIKYHEWMKNPILQYLTSSEPLTLEEEFKMQKRWLEDEDKCTFIILDKHVYLTTKNEIDAMVGDTNLFLHDSQGLCVAEIEIMIAEEANRGKRRGWESIILMLLYGAETLNINKFCAKIKLDNAVSIRMFEKLGFREKRPLLFNSMVYGFFYTSAEFIRQSFTKMSKPIQLITVDPENSSNIKGPVLIQIQKLCEMLDLVDKNSNSATYNWPQLKRYAIFGCLLAGPILHGWYKWLDTFYSGKSTKIVLKKLFVDQFILTPPLIILFFISMSLMEAKSDLLQECKIKFVHTFQTSCGYWLPVQFVNFLLIPPSFRVTYVSIAAFCWVNILCYLKNLPVSEHKQKIKY
ncbi:PREDICTED: N-acetyltransferase 9-like protein [Trachymyrmex cornetzi]|uniref:N-acetyltransferase 9-like protein n=1 Tax=Trachymyrmex cornetzi TaxID=471704 RepID=A0A195EGI6_9HYME|nr:PREDICTED: N-acetyltransferase 9-like protein [Trachymyrmex cornetzi]KYN27261.1 N-acetyltransferase 9-like protein [Trachymyrmex cornetzi]